MGKWDSDAGEIALTFDDHRSGHFHGNPGVQGNQLDGRSSRRDSMESCDGGEEERGSRQGQAFVNRTKTKSRTGCMYARRAASAQMEMLRVTCPISSLLY